VTALEQAARLGTDPICLTRAFSLIWLSFQGMPVMTSNSAAAPAAWHVGGDAPNLVRVALAAPDGT